MFCIVFAVNYSIVGLTRNCLKNGKRIFINY
jgi:hypothetical protein